PASVALWTMKLYEAQKKLSEFDEPYAEYFPHFPKATASWNESILLLVDLQVLLTMTRYLDSFVVVLFWRQNFWLANYYLRLASIHYQYQIYQEDLVILIHSLN